MNRRLSIFIMMLAVLLSVQMPAKKDTRLRVKNQEHINRGQTLPERFNRMGEVFVEALKTEVQDIIDKNKWKELGLEERKIYLFISFKKVEKAGEVTLDKILNPGDKSLNLLKIAVYEMLANAIKSAINNDLKLKDYIVTLSVDPGTLQAVIAETGDPMYNQSKKLEFSRMDSMNANYHFFFEAFQQTNKIVLGGRADIIERNHEIASTYNYEISAKELFDKYSGQKNPVPDPPPINEINLQHVEVNPLKVSIICKRKEESTSFEVGPHVVLYTGDRIWFDITLPELGGYLLVYAKDSHGKVFNLFPGTQKAIREGKYRFPYHLENYSTEVLKVAREQSVDLPGNKLRIGGYTLDENTGSENVYFYYSNQRDKRLENYLEKYAAEVGKDIKFKGFESKVEKYTPDDVNASISTPLLHYTETHLSLKHE
jgi:hypothetical protein